MILSFSVNFTLTYQTESFSAEQFSSYEYLNIGTVKNARCDHMNLCYQILEKFINIYIHIHIFRVEVTVLNDSGLPKVKFCLIQNIIPL